MSARVEEGLLKQYLCNAGFCHGSQAWIAGAEELVGPAPNFANSFCRCDRRRKKNMKPSITSMLHTMSTKIQMGQTRYLLISIGGIIVRVFNNFGLLSTNTDSAVRLGFYSPDLPHFLWGSE